MVKRENGEDSISQRHDQDAAPGLWQARMWLPDGRRRGLRPFRKFVAVKPASLEPTPDEAEILDSDSERQRIIEALKRDMPGLSLSVDLAREALNQQMSQADSLDTKAGFILGSASILIAVLTAWRKPVPHVWWLSALAYVCVGLAIGGYGWILWQAARGYAVAEYSVMADPKPLTENIIFQDEKTARYLTLLAIQKAIMRNETTLAAKVKYLQFAFGGLVVETVFVAAVLVLELAFS